jgi:hypothetical protein
MSSPPNPVSRPLAATSLAFAYDEPEDRLILLASDAGGHGLTLTFTRLLTGRLINALCVILEKTSLSVSKAPAELRDDVILLEHQGAMSAQGPASPRGPQQRAANDHKHLVTNVEITPLAAGFVVIFRDAHEPQVRSIINRVALHRMVDVIARQAEAANWNIAIESSWLEPGQKHIVLN